MSGFDLQPTFLLRCFWMLLLLHGVLSIGIVKPPVASPGQDGRPPPMSSSLTLQMGPSGPSSASQPSSASLSSTSPTSPSTATPHHTNTKVTQSSDAPSTSNLNSTGAVTSPSTPLGDPTMTSPDGSPTNTSAGPTETQSSNTPSPTAPPSINSTSQSPQTPSSVPHIFASSKSKKTTAIAAGVTAPIVVIVLAAGGILFYRRRQRARDRREWERTHEEIADAVRQVGAGGSGSVAASGVTRGSSRSAWSRMELMPRDPSLSEEPALPVGMMAASAAGSDAHAAYAFPYADSADGHFVNTAGVGAGGASVQRAATNPFRRTAGTNPFLDRAPFSDYVYPKSVSPPPPGAGYDPAAQAAWSHQQQNAPEPAFYSDEPGSRPASSMGGASAAHADTPYGSQSHAR